jgi:alpha-ribazole phosphatase
MSLATAGPLRLWLVRHAQPLIDPGICYGALDVPADPATTAQCAAELARTLPQGAFLTTSTLQRCELLAHILRGLRPDLASKTDARLAEMDFGAWEGQHWDAIGEAALSQWTDNFASHRPGGGESVQAFMQRVAAALRQTADDARAQGRSDAVWVTHAGVIRAASLIAGGINTVSRADQWPLEGPAWGETVVLTL